MLSIGYWVSGHQTSDIRFGRIQISDSDSDFGHEMAGVWIMLVGSYLIDSGGFVKVIGFEGK